MTSVPDLWNPVVMSLLGAAFFSDPHANAIDLHHPQMGGGLCHGHRSEENYQEQTLGVIPVKPKLVRLSFTCMGITGLAAKANNGSSIKPEHFLDMIKLSLAFKVMI